MDALDDLRLRQAQQVVVATLVARAAAVVAVGVLDVVVGVVVTLCETLAAVGGFVQLVLLDHGAHRAVDHQDAFAQQLLQRLRAFGVQPGQGFHQDFLVLRASPGLRPISAITSKCGGDARA